MKYIILIMCLLGGCTNQVQPPANTPYVVIEPGAIVVQIGSTTQPVVLVNVSHLVSETQPNDNK
jgi:hypothetical protein